ncbi:MAG: aminotransferase class IV, partial [Pseudomonadota bacterium]
QQAAEAGLAVVTCKDPRWARCDIKTVMLLPASLAKEQAKARGAQEAWFIDDSGNVLEGGSSNAWIVTQQNEVVTRPADKAILRGVTRTTLIDTLEAAGLTFVERAFTLEEAFAANEAFLTSATNMVMPIVKVDDQMIGNGKPGPVVAQLRRLFHTVASSEPIT